jgi:hypothetical protein
VLAEQVGLRSSDGVGMPKRRRHWEIAIYMILTSAVEIRGSRHENLSLPNPVIVLNHG